MSVEPSSRLALAPITLDETLERITRLVALGRDAVEQDPFPRMRAGLAAEIQRARATMAEPEPPAGGEPAPRA